MPLECERTLSTGNSGSQELHSFPGHYFTAGQEIEHLQRTPACIPASLKRLEYLTEIV